MEELMYHGDTCASIYKIMQEQCKNRKSDNHRNWFGHDTSNFDWSKLPLITDKDYSCAIYNENSYKSYVIEYKYGRHDYVFENIFRFTISREKCGNKDTMIFVFPIKISSFETMIDLGRIYFEPGVYNIDEALIYTIGKSEDVYITLPDNIKFREYKK